jgi:4-aminobutyrate aminotransferase-like enzyme
MAYLDFAAGFGSLKLVHIHPEVVAAIVSALGGHAPRFSPKTS